jgi:Reverse transcriptase (RNA-dependent DNA polymerase)
VGGGKLTGRAAIAANMQPSWPGRLAVLTGTVSKVVYLVDTGAVHSVIPHTSSAAPSGPAITAADGTAILCWGWKDITVTAGGRVFRWRFLLAAVAFAMIGSSFLAFFYLQVDLRRLRLVKRGDQNIQLQEPPRKGVFSLYGIGPAAAVEETSPVGSLRAGTSSPLALQCSPSSALPCSSPSALHGSTPSLQGGHPADALPLAVAALVLPDYNLLLADFPEVVNAAKSLPAVTHNVQHFIETEGRPVASKYRRLDPERLAAARAEFDSMEKQGIVRRSASNLSSLLHMVKKADGTWRPCRDFRRLNLQTTEDRYTCPNIGDLTACLAGCRVFSKLDRRKGYHQVPVNPAYISKTAVITPFGLYEFLRMPFGLRNAGQTFQRLMDDIMAGLPFCFVYLDDVLVGSVDHQQHQHHLREVLSRLKQYGLVIL